MIIFNPTDLPFLVLGCPWCIPGQKNGFQVTNTKYTNKNICDTKTSEKHKVQKKQKNSVIQKQVTNTKYTKTKNSLRQKQVTNTKYTNTKTSVRQKPTSLGTRTHSCSGSRQGTNRVTLKCCKRMFLDMSIYICRYGYMSICILSSDAQRRNHS